MSEIPGKGGENFIARIVNPREVDARLMSLPDDREPELLAAVEVRRTDLARARDLLPGSRAMLTFRSEGVFRTYEANIFSVTKTRQRGNERIIAEFITPGGTEKGSIGGGTFARPLA